MILAVTGLIWYCSAILSKSAFLAYNIHLASVILLSCPCLVLSLSILPGPANAGTIHPNPAPYPGRNVVACVRKGITNLLCSRAYTTLTAPVNRIAAGYMAGHLFVSGPKNASTISTMAIG